MESQKKTEGRSWGEASGLLHILRILRLAVSPSKIAIAFASIVATFIVGGVLDSIWGLGGGVGADAITQFIDSKERDTAYQEPTGEYGIFNVWREHQRRNVLGLLASSLPGSSVSLGTPIGNYVESHGRSQPLRYFASIYYGNWWLIRHHFLFAVLFGAGALVIWSLGGGTMCRLAAVEFARDEKPTLAQALRFTLDKLWGGFVLAPCIPLAFVFIAILLMILVGCVIRIPWLGDVVGGLLFFLPLLGGFFVVLMLAGMLLGGGLLWPSVAAEGSDAFDAFQRSVSYSLWKLWKTIYYITVVTVFASFCWVVANLGTFVALSIARAALGFGSSWFGFWPKEAGPQPLSKIDHLWPMIGPNALHAWPSGSLGVFEYFSAACVWVWVMVFVGLVWAFLASFYHTAWTVLYFLLRRDVDMIEIDEVYIEETEPPTLASIPPKSASTAS